MPRINQVMKHAFEALPGTVLSTPLGQQVFRVMQRQVAQKGSKGNFRRGTKGGGKA
jgi:hypothetical protein